MKKSLIFGILISIILISGAGCEKSKCNSPYFEYETGKCCLDKNDNKICDNDEKDYQPVQAITVEDCTDNSYFDCTWSYITKEEVQFNLKARKNGIITIEKIELPNLPCSKKFDNLVMKYNDEEKITILCNSKKDSFESEYIITGEFSEFKSGSKTGTEDYYTSYSKYTTQGWISGMIR